MSTRTKTTSVFKDSDVVETHFTIHDKYTVLFSCRLTPIVLSFKMIRNTVVYEYDALLVVFGL